MHKVTIISGPCGSGKSTMANDVAASISAEGRIAHLSEDNFCSRFPLIEGCDVVIVDECRLNARMMPRIRRMCTEPSIIINRKGKNVLAMKTPKLILVLEPGARVTNEVQTSRRFEVTTLPPHKVGDWVIGDESEQAAT